MDGPPVVVVEPLAPAAEVPAVAGVNAGSPELAGGCTAGIETASTGSLMTFLFAQLALLDSHAVLWIPAQAHYIAYIMYRLGLLRRLTAFNFH